MDNSTPPSTQRYAPPTAEVADVSTGDAAQLAGRGARLGAVMIDTLILLALWWVVSRISPWNIYSSAMAKAGFLTLVGMTLFGMLMFAAVHGYLLATRGQTVGKMLLVRRRLSCASLACASPPAVCSRWCRSSARCTVWLTR
jgi:RDD family